MKLHIVMLAATLLLSGGASYAQGNKQEKKAKAYMEAFMVSINKKFQAKGGDMNG